MSSSDAASLSGEAAASAGSVTREVNKPALLVAVAGAVLAADLVTKAWVVSNFALYQTVEVWGEFFRLTYTHNPGAAFGINIGEHSRIFFLVLALLALAFLGWLYLETPAWDRLRLWSLSLVTGGAVGNIIDRIRYERGVVDFLDFGIGSTRWPVFNVADMAVSVGAVLLLVSFYREERREGRERADAGG